MSKLMKVFNLTDIPTPELTRSGLVGVFVVGRTPVLPGQYAEVPDTPRTHTRLRRLIEKKAAALHELPAEYVKAKNRAQAEAGASPRGREGLVRVARTRPAGASAVVTSAPSVPPSEPETGTLGSGNKKA